jgi:hypothetical protein
LTIHHLERLLSPTSVAVFGSSNRHGSVGATVGEADGQFVLLYWQTAG